MSEPRNQLNRLCFMPDARPRASGKFPRASARALTFIALLICAKAQATATTQPEPDYVEHEVLVQFQPEITWESVDAIAASQGLKVAQRFDWLSAQQGRVLCLLRSTNQTTAEMIAALSGDPAVALAEPNHLRWPVGMRAPNDPQFGQLWGLRNTGQSVNGLAGTTNADIGFLAAWGLARPTTNEVVVGVIDTGLDVTHPDLTNNLWTNPGELSGNGVDDDGNGYVDDVHGYDFALGTGSLTDSGHHGTHVAGTIAASGNNNLGIIGVDFQAHLMGLKASANGSNFTASVLISAIQYATMMKSRGVNVVALNASYGGGSYNDSERSAMLAAGAAGIIFCAAAGNNAANNDAVALYPASYRLTNMIVVAASDQNDSLASFSDYGATTVDLAAPGVNILSCAPVSQPGYTTYVQVSNQVFLGDAMEYSGVTPSNGISGTVYYCGLGNPGDFPSAVSNNLALILRGTLTFADKTANAMTAGARAVIVFNNASGSFLGTLGSSGNWVPVVSLSQADGLALQATLPTAGTAYNFLDSTMIYQLLDGTSMATPHLSGAVAFAAMNFPSESVGQRIARILTNVTPVAALSGKVATGGRLNLSRSVDTDGNGLPDWWEQQYFGHLTGTDASADPDHDGASNLAEFLAGTDPTNARSAFRIVAVPSGSSNLSKLQWPSIAGRYYRLLRGTNSSSGFGTAVLTNLAATPPLNVVTDTLPMGIKSTFYRVQLEE